MSQLPNVCPHCGIEPLLIREEREVPLGQRRLLIEDEWSRCPQCGEDFYMPVQADRRHRLALERARLEDGLLSPTEIRQIRASLGLTQREFEGVLGVGEKTVVRWETGRVCQNKSADRLVRLVAANRQNLRALAAINGVSLREEVEDSAVAGIPWNSAAAVFVSRRLLGHGTSETRPTPHNEDLNAVQGAIADVAMRRLTSEAFLTNPVRR